MYIMKSILEFFRPQSEIATESHIQPFTSPGNVGISLSSQFKELGVGADFEGNRENDVGSAVDRETGVLSSAFDQVYLPLNFLKLRSQSGNKIFFKKQ